MIEKCKLGEKQEKLPPKYVDCNRIESKANKYENWLDNEL